MVRIDRGVGFHGAAFHVHLVDEYDRVALADNIARRHGNSADDAAAVRRDVVLKLHRLDDRDQLTDPHLVTNNDLDVDNGALNRRCQTDRTLRPLRSLVFLSRSSGDNWGAADGLRSAHPGQEVGQEIVAGSGEDRLGVELDALDVEVPVS